MIRKEIVAGQFYPGDFDSLDKCLKGCFEDRFGPGALPLRKRKGRIFGAVVPHAGYEFSGQAAAWAYKAIAEAEQPDLFVIVGVNHRGVGKDIALSLADFSTPSGLVKNDKDFAKAIIKAAQTNYKIDIGQDEKAHAFEHSIEVQLPFLLFITKNPKFVPVIMGSYNYNLCKTLAKIIMDVAKRLRKKICVIASSDFTHYGHAYGFIPFSSKVKENLYKLDRGAINKIIDLDAKSFIDYTQSTTICGAGAIATVVEACKAFGSKKAELLKYYTSGDVVKDYSTVVGYAAIVFK